MPSLRVEADTSLPGPLAQGLTVALDSELAGPAWSRSPAPGSL